MPICVKCNTSIKPAALACHVSGKEYHPTCINCSVCDKRLWGVPFIRLKDGRLVCEKTCAGNQAASTNKPSIVRSETRTIIRKDDPQNESDALNEFTEPLGGSSTARLKNFDPNSFESQLDADLTPRPKQDKSNKARLETSFNSLQDELNKTKKCKNCNQSVAKKRHITFENGEIICHDCDLMNTPRPPRIKSAHLILCSVCDKTVRGTRYITEADGKIICEKCETTGDRCSKCNLLIKINENHRRLANGEKFHAECFCCNKCGSNIVETENFYETENGEPMCLSCYEASKLPKCFKCSNYISGSFLMSDNKPIHSQCFRCAECNDLLNIELGYFKNAENEPICFNCNLKQTGAKCKKCLKFITHDGVSFADSDYHQACFKCDICSNDLLRMRQVYTDKKNQGIFCMTCFIQNISPKCDKCHMPIAPHQMTAIYEDKNLHRECFLCARCKKTLINKKFFKAGTLLICEDCF